MEEQTPNERPSGPPPETDGSMTRWIIAVFALALLILGGYKGYQWWAAEHSVPVETEAAAPVSEPAASAAEQNTPDKPADAPPPPTGEADLRAPAVAGDNIINKCVMGGQVTYTNDPCPEGSTTGTVEATAIDPNGVTGFTGDKAPAATERAPASDDPSQRAAECDYLAAEIARMDYEFKQPLPPPVLDQIATDLKNAREQGASLKCTGIPKASAEAKSASDSKMLKEKGE